MITISKYHYIGNETLLEIEGDVEADNQLLDRGFSTGQIDALRPPAVAKRDRRIANEHLLLGRRPARG